MYLSCQDGLTSLVFPVDEMRSEITFKYENVMFGESGPFWRAKKKTDTF